MNPLDIAAVAVLVLSALFGLTRGFAREVLALAAWIGAALGAVAFFPLLAPPLRRFADRHLDLPPVVGDVVAGALAFIVLLVVLSAIAAAIARLVRRTPFVGVDRALGLGFGLLRGAAILIVAYILVGLLYPPGEWPPVFRHARATPLAWRGASFVAALLPPGARPHVAAPDERLPSTDAAAAQKV